MRGATVVRVLQNALQTTLMTEGGIVGNIDAAITTGRDVQEALVTLKTIETIEAVEDDTDTIVQGRRKGLGETRHTLNLKRLSVNPHLPQATITSKTKNATAPDSVVSFRRT